MVVQTDNDDNFAPVGSEGFYTRGGKKATYDQQPIEAATTIEACEAAFHLTGQSRWRREMERAFSWLCGSNSAGMPLFDAETGACCDGVTPTGLNQNNGAESTLAFLVAQLAIRRTRDRAASDSTTQSGGAFLG